MTIKLNVYEIYLKNIKNSFLVGNGEKKFANVWLKSWLNDMEYTRDNDYIFPCSYQEMVSLVKRINFPEYINTKINEQAMKVILELSSKKDKLPFVNIEIDFISKKITYLKTRVLNSSKNYMQLLNLYFLAISDDPLWIEDDFSPKYFFSAVLEIPYKSTNGFEKFIKEFCHRETSIKNRKVETPLYSILCSYEPKINEEFNLYGIVSTFSSPMIWFASVQVIDYDNSIRLYCDTEITWALDLIKSLGDEIIENFGDNSRVKKITTQFAWEKIEDKNWDREVVKLWWNGLSVPEICRKTHLASEERIRNRISELRSEYGKEVIPYDRERRRKMVEQLNCDIE